MAYAKSARYLFPFDKEILVGEALATVRNSQNVNNYTYMLLKEALIYDPYSAEILGMYTQYAEIFKNRNEAILAFNTMKKIVPNSNSFKQLQTIMKGF